MAASFAYMVTVAVPGTPGVSWLAHLGGLVGGMVGAYLLRDGRRPAAVPGEARPAAPLDPGRADLHKELRDLGLL
ncbi:rhomboid family intramembrane serine protease [Streptomyces mauvecolor]|uniref:Rhomboid family intramembrane serine protease n=1 Tax=Streptomyces mauvecolor TaxID=58345 RepID=A0ABV9UYV4_9ACTN